MRNLFEDGSNAVRNYWKVSNPRHFVKFLKISYLQQAFCCALLWVSRLRLPGVFKCAGYLSQKAPLLSSRLFAGTAKLFILVLVRGQ